jgi:hypothetical protein
MRVDFELALVKEHRDCDCGKNADDEDNDKKLRVNPDSCSSRIDLSLANIYFVSLNKK